MNDDSDDLSAIGAGKRRLSSRGWRIAGIVAAIALFAVLGAGIGTLSPDLEFLPVVAVAAVVLGALALTVWLIED